MLQAELLLSRRIRTKTGTNEACVCATLSPYFGPDHWIQSFHHYPQCSALNDETRSTDPYLTNTAACCNRKNEYTKWSKSEEKTCPGGQKRNTIQRIISVDLLRQKVTAGSPPFLVHFKWTGWRIFWTSILERYDNYFTYVCRSQMPQHDRGWGKYSQMTVGS